MRSLLLPLALACSALAFGDRLILIPTAIKIPYGTAKLEHMFDGAEPRHSRTALGFGFNQSIDAEITFENQSDQDQILSFDISYNLLPAIAGFSPGISVGVRDGIAKSEEGRYFYGAVTYKMPTSDDFLSDLVAEATLGIAYGDRKTAFVGASVPFSRALRLLAEFDTRKVSGGLEYRPRQDLWVRWIHRDDESLWSLTLVRKF